MKENLSEVIKAVFSSEIDNFLSLGVINDFRVVKGSNNLNTCF